MKPTENTQETSLVVRCYEQLQHDIINGVLVPGQKLKIDQLSKDMGIGHSPVREALSRMVATGLVQAQDNRGFRVTQISESDIRDLYQTLLQIDLLALEGAMHRGNDAWEGKIVAALHQLALIETRNSQVAYEEWARRNEAFHQALIAGCQSPALLEIRNNLHLRCDRYSRIAFHQSKRTLDLNHDEHKGIAEAVLARSMTQLRPLIEHHILGAVDDVVSVLRKNGML